MFGRNKTADSVDDRPVVAVLPAGHDDPDSPWHVPTELRDDYQRADVPLAAIERAEQQLERELITAEAAAQQEPIVQAWLERLKDAGDTAGYTQVRQLFYGGGYGKVYQIGTSAIQEQQPEHPFRPRHMPERNLRIPDDRYLTADERELAEHRARLAAADHAAAERVRQAKAREWMTCSICGGFGDAAKRTVRVAGCEPVHVRACGLCESALTLELRRRAALRPLPDGRTRVQAATAFLDQL